MRTVLFVSPHFPPDSAAGTHRARVVAPHLARFGWRPIVLTVNPESVEGELDRQLGASVSRDLRVERVDAWPHAWTRRAGFGDLGLRAYAPLKRVAMRLARTEGVRATLVTTYPTYPALIGAAMKRRLGVPFLLDLQDPWVGAWGHSVGPGGVPDLRSRASRLLATRLEVRAATSADALMSVTRRTIEDLAARVPAAGRLPQLEVPIGWEPSDWDRVRADSAPNGIFDPRDGHVHVCAVGTLLPTALDGCKAFLEGVALALRQESYRQRLRVWFIGTSNECRVNAPAIVRPLITTLGLSHVVREHAPRLAYFDALRVLRDAHGVLVLGSNEPHYTPSRVFPGLASRRPIVARLHRASPAWQLLSAAGASRSVQLIDASMTFGEQAQAFATAIARMLASPEVTAGDDAPLAPYTGEALARRVAALLDQVCG